MTTPTHLLRADRRRDVACGSVPVGLVPLRETIDAVGFGRVKTPVVTISTSAPASGAIGRHAENVAYQDGLSRDEAAGGRHDGERVARLDEVFHR